MDIALSFHLHFLSLLPSFLNRMDKETPAGSGSQSSVPRNCWYCLKPISAFSRLNVMKITFGRRFYELCVSHWMLISVNVYRS